MPNSVLLRSDSWGHTAYGTSDCVTDRVDTYLLTGTVPGDTADTVCVGDVQPFTTAAPEDDTNARSGTQVSSASTSTRTQSSTARTETVPVPSRKGLPPVTLPLPPVED
jgi:hypothetical protein